MKAKSTSVVISPFSLPKKYIEQYMEVAQKKKPKRKDKAKQIKEQMEMQKKLMEFLQGKSPYRESSR